MYKKNYSKMSSEKAKNENAIDTLNPIDETIVNDYTVIGDNASDLESVTTAISTPEEVVVKPAVKTEKGKVYNCVKLNIRKEPKADAEVVGTIDADSTVTILDEAGDFYKIENGYCMKKFIKTKS